VQQPKKAFCRNQQKAAPFVILLKAW